MTGTGKLYFVLHFVFQTTQTAKRLVYKNKIHMVSTDRKKNRNLKETVIIRKKKLNEENKERIENETE